MHRLIQQARNDADLAKSACDDPRNADGQIVKDLMMGLPAVAGGRPPPPECGGASTPFGAIELSNAQALVAGLAVDALRGIEKGPAWRSWLPRRYL